MAKLAVTIPSSLEIARENSQPDKTSLDNLVSAALSEYLHFSPRRMSQISTQPLFSKEFIRVPSCLYAPRARRHWPRHF